MRYHFIATALAAQLTLSAAMPQSAYAASTDCEALDNACRTGPDANMASCSAKAAACKACEEADSSCRVGPDANMASCSAKKAACVGEAYPAEASAAAAAAAATTAAPSGDGPKTVYQTEMETITSCGPEVTNCPARSTHPATGTASGPAPSGTSSGGQSCQDKENACRTAPDANMAQCSAERAACDGYIPGQPSGTTSAPHGGETVFTTRVQTITSCGPEVTNCPARSTGTASGPAPSGTASGSPSCQDKENACRTAPGANMAQCSAERAACDGYVPGQPSGGSGQTCQEKENACRTAPGANMASCSAERAACDGYVPGQPGNATASLSTPTPTPAQPTPAQWTGAASTSFVSFGVMALGAAAAAFVM
ncbi:hypothetical protein GTA08_BOTSDO00410 [Botryosphaeria dothidea]|uniref:Uncharacterized protein n=1 Tax=Botryosphaeria dothidea TaxID=55169 RepID=A0A8H4NGL7_9PEZI|nr:hypothetical protein GTA08_BOTSDO00410 [Botryosphaeria dothidea]